MTDDAKVCLVKRLRFADDEPLLLEYSYFRKDVGDRLQNEDLTNSIYSLLEKKFGLVLNRSVNTVEAQLAKEEEAAILGVSEGSPVLVLRRIVYFEEETPFEYAKDIYRADRTKFKIRTHQGHLIEKSPIESF